jgi:hypothetical protein
MQKFTASLLNMRALINLFALINRFSRKMYNDIDLTNKFVMIAAHNSQ